MKHIKTFSLFESAQELTLWQKDFLDRYTKGSWSFNPSDGTVDVQGDFDISWRALGFKNKNLKGVKFGKVTGDFKISGNEFKKLEGFPVEVGGDFMCDSNYLRDLKGAPKIVGGTFDCSDNSTLKSLEGAPQIVGGDFDCNRCGLTSLKGSPEVVKGYFDCRDNSLTTLEGAPDIIEGEFLSNWIEYERGKWNFYDLISFHEREKNNFPGRIMAGLVDPKELQKRINKNPERMAVALKDHINKIQKFPGYENIKFPKHIQQEADILANLSRVGQ
jgi:hypothetical protein